MKYVGENVEKINCKNRLTTTEIGSIIISCKKRIQKGWKQIPPFDYEYNKV